MKESLTCNSCGSTWKRDKTRGRKPNFCPKCVKAQTINEPKVKEKTAKSTRVVKAKRSIKAVIKEEQAIVKDAQEIKVRSHSDLTVSKVLQSFHPKALNYKEIQESTKNGSTWKCTNCGNILKLEISVTDIPHHRCTPDMVSIKPYERIK